MTEEAVTDTSEVLTGLTVRAIHKTKVANEVLVLFILLLGK
jgi:hypothetical protein